MESRWFAWLISKLGNYRIIGRYQGVNSTINHHEELTRYGWDFNPGLPMVTIWFDGYLGQWDILTWLYYIALIHWRWHEHKSDSESIWLHPEHIDQHWSVTGMHDQRKRCDKTTFPKDITHMTMPPVLIIQRNFFFRNKLSWTLQESDEEREREREREREEEREREREREGREGECSTTDFNNRHRNHENILLHPIPSVERRSIDASPATGIWSWWNAWWTREKEWRNPRRGFVNGWVP